MQNQNRKENTTPYMIRNKKFKKINYKFKKIYQILDLQLMKK